MRAQGGPFGAPDFVVDCEGGGDFEDIQSAIDASASGQWIEVWPCVYRERIDFKGRNVFLRAPEGADQTVIDGQNGGAVVVAENGENDEAGLQGFTLRNGSGETVRVELSSLHLSDVVIEDGGGSYGLLANSANVEVDNLTIVDNDFTFAALYADRGALAVKNSVVDCANGTYGIYSGHGATYVDWSDLTCTGNFDWAFFSQHTVGRVMRTVLDGDAGVENEDDHYDDEIVFVSNVHEGDVWVEYGTLTLRNSIVTGTVDLQTITAPVISSNIFVGGGCAIASDLVAIAPAHNNFWGVDSGCGYGDPDYVGVDGNIEEEPGFVDPFAGDYHLEPASALVDRGDPDPFWDDVDGTRNDIGPFGGRYSQDGGW
jgi:hypothetical protein